MSDPEPHVTTEAAPRPRSRRGRRALLLWGIALVLAGAGVAAWLTTPPADINGPGPPTRPVDAKATYRLRIAALVRALESPREAVRQGARAAFRLDGARAVPVLLSMLATDARFSAPYRMRLESLDPKARHFAADFVWRADVPEALPALIDAAARREHALESTWAERILRTYGDTGLDAVFRRSAPQNRLSARVSRIFDAIPVIERLRYLAAESGAADAVQRQRARQELSFLWTRDVVYAPDYAEQLQAITEAVPALRESEARLWLLKRIDSAIALDIETERWFIPVLARALADCGGDPYLVGPYPLGAHSPSVIGDLLLTPRRQSVIDRFDAWIAAHEDEYDQPTLSPLHTIARFARQRFEKFPKTTLDPWYRRIPKQPIPRPPRTETPLDPEVFVDPFPTFVATPDAKIPAETFDAQAWLPSSPLIDALRACGTPAFSRARALIERASTGDATSGGSSGNPGANPDALAWRLALGTRLVAAADPNVPVDPAWAADLAWQSPRAAYGGPVAPLPRLVPRVQPPGGPEGATDSLWQLWFSTLLRLRLGLRLADAPVRAMHEATVAAAFAAAARRGRASPTPLPMRLIEHLQVALQAELARGLADASEAELPALLPLVAVDPRRPGLTRLRQGALGLASEAPRAPVPLRALVRQRLRAAPPVAGGTDLRTAGFPWPRMTWAGPAIAALIAERASASRADLAFLIRLVQIVAVTQPAPAARATLAPLIDTPEVALRRAVVTALPLGDEAANAPLVRALDDSDPSVRVAAAERLLGHAAGNAARLADLVESLLSASIAPELLRRLVRAFAEAPLVSERLDAVLRRTLTTPGLAPAAAWAMKQRQARRRAESPDAAANPEDVAALLGVVRERTRFSSSARAMALSSAAALAPKAPRVREAVRTHLTDADPTVAAEAFTVLASLKDPADLASVCAALSAAPAETQRLMLRYLAGFTDRDTVVAAVAPFLNVARDARRYTDAQRALQLELVAMRALTQHPTLAGARALAVALDVGAFEVPYASVLFYLARVATPIPEVTRVLHRLLVYRLPGARGTSNRPAKEYFAAHWDDAEVRQTLREAFLTEQSYFACLQILSVFVTAHDRTTLPLIVEQKDYRPLVYPPGRTDAAWPVEIPRALLELVPEVEATAPGAGTRAFWKSWLSAHKNELGANQ